MSSLCNGTHSTTRRGFEKRREERSGKKESNTFFHQMAHRQQSGPNSYCCPLLPNPPIHTTFEPKISVASTMCVLLLLHIPQFELGFRALGSNWKSYILDA